MPSKDETFNQAVILRSEGKLQQAYDLLMDLRASCQQDPDYFFELGMTCYHLNQLENAVSALTKNLELDPNGNAAWVNLGACYNQLGLNEEAVVCYEKALLLKPDSATTWGNLAKALHDNDEHETSIYCYRQALKYSRTPQNLRGLALAYRKCGRYDRSLLLLDEALTINHNDERAHFGLAMNYLYLQDYKRALPHFEWRAKLPKQLAFRADYPQIFDYPEYSGEDLTDKTLLLYTEQGFGDSIQFSRFVPLAIEKACKVVMWCRPGLGKLFKHNFNAHKVTEDETQLPYFDYHMSLMSLPYFFDPELASLSTLTPYIKPEVKTKALQTSSSDSKNIGLVWGADQKGYEYGKKNVPLHALESLFDLPNINWFSLQVGNDRNELNTFPHKNKISDLGINLKNFADTAKIISQMDLVISCDTAVAHLAGAMGIPCWVMLHKNPDWRWHSTNGISSWYSLCQLYQQTTYGDWQQVKIRLGRNLIETNKYDN